MTPSLRPYQSQGIAELREAYRKHLRILFVAPTGSGKTVIFSQICASAIERGKRVLILTDRIEIFGQTLRTMAHHQIPVCKIDADNKRIDSGAQLFIGMVESFKRRLPLFSAVKFDLIICDEAHKAAFRRIFDAYPETHVMGCTATPVWKEQHKYYSHMVQTVDIPELIQQGFLSPCRGYEMQDDFSDLETDNSGEFTEASQFSHFSKSKIYDGLIKEYMARCQDRKTLVFCVNIEHIEQTVRAFNTVGIKAYGISSRTSDQERDWILSEYKRGAFRVLVNANIFVAGFDEPSIDCIMINRATTSLSFWLQSAGRGSRVYPGKRDFLLIDFGGNFSRLGLWDEPRTWTLAPPKKRKKGLGAAPVKSCKACSAMLPAMARECPYCGYLFAPTEKELAQGKLVEVTNRIREGIEGRYVSQLTVPELIECEKTKVLTPKFVWRVLRGREHGLAQYAEIKKYRDHWLALQYEAADAEKLADKEARERGEIIRKADWKINEVPKMLI